MSDSPTSEFESTFVCDCGETQSTACAGEPFYKEHEGKRYCVLHFPGKEKSADFEKAFQRKLGNKDFNFCGAWFPDPLSFANFEFDGDVNFSLATFSDEADFSEATFSANAYFDSVTFTAAASFISATFSGHASFSQATFSAAADFVSATFGAEASFFSTTFSAEASFFSTTFSAAASFNSATFGAEAYFIEATFSADAYFSKATFGAEADFSKATFSGEADFDSANFSAVANFIDGTFSAKVHFSEATFSANADFSKDTFGAEVDFRRCTFSAVADFSAATFGGDAYFSKATFSAAAYFSKAIFNAGAYFNSAIFSADAEFFIFTLQGKMDFWNVTFKGRVDFGGNENTSVFTDSSSLDLQFATIEKPDRLAFRILSLHPHWFLNVDASKFDFVKVRWRNKGKAKPELRLLNDNKVSSPHHLLAIACRRLAANAEGNYRYPEASDFRRMAMDAERLETWRGFRIIGLSWWYWLASGYGERPFQALLVLLGIMLLSAVFYNHVGFARWEPRLASESEVASAKRDIVGAPLPFTRALTYSVGVMTLQKPEPRPATTWAQTVVLLETILGPVQAALLALAIRRKFMR